MVYRHIKTIGTTYALILGTEIACAVLSAALRADTRETDRLSLRELADGYDPAASEAPLVVGHPKLNAPAYGWVKSIRAEAGCSTPNRTRWSLSSPSSSTRALQSASFYLPDSPGNPKPGSHYVRHVGFLGAAAPSVKLARKLHAMHPCGYTMQVSCQWIGR